MNGKRIAVFGLGRSGLAIAKAAKQLGASPRVFDETPLERLAKRDVYDEAVAEGIEVTLGWDSGEGFPPSEIDTIVTNPAVDMRHPALRRAVEEGLEIISEVEFAYRISKAPIVAITGTNGKSTTTVMTYHCLLACGEEAVLCGNIFGSGYPEVPLTEAALNSTPDQVLVAEISSFQLEWVKDFKPAAAGITNIWPDHLDRYDSFDQYAATKHRIFAAQDEDCYTIVRAHDPVVQAPGTRGFLKFMKLVDPLRPNKAGPHVLTFGSTAEHGRVEEREIVVLDQKVKLSELHFTEPHNHQNAAMAALLAYGALAWKAKHRPDSAGAKLFRAALDQANKKVEEKRTPYNRLPDAEYALPPEIIQGLRDFKGIAHRMEFVGERNGVRVINNSMCTNPDAVLKSATAVKGPNHLLIGGRNKDLDFRPLKHYLASGMHHAYLYGEARESLREQLGDFPVFTTMQEAFAAASQKARSGEIIMLAPGCASTDQFRDFRERGNVFKEIAKEWLDS